MRDLQYNTAPFALPAVPRDRAAADQIHKLLLCRAQLRVSVAVKRLRCHIVSSF